MAGDKASGVLRGLMKARQSGVSDDGRIPQMPAPPPLTPARVVGTAVARAADRLYSLGVHPIEVRPGAISAAELPELLPENALLSVLQGPGDSVGVIALDAQAVAALIEIQTIGRVTARPVPHRALTRIDAMLCADFIDAFLADLSSDAVGIEGLDGTPVYHFANHLADPRPLGLIMEDRPCLSLAMRLRLGGDETRIGTIFLALPQSELAPRIPAPRARLAAPASAPVAPPAGGAVGSTAAGPVLDAPVTVVGVLCRRTMSLRELRSLAPGSILPLPRLDLSQTRLETGWGQLLAVGKFGEAQGCHAIRLRHATSPAPASQPSPAEGRPVGRSIAEPALDPDHPDDFRRAPLAAAEILPLDAGNAALRG